MNSGKLDLNLEPFFIGDLMKKFVFVILMLFPLIGVCDEPRFDGLSDMQNWYSDRDLGLREGSVIRHWGSNVVMVADPRNPKLRRGGLYNPMRTVVFSSSRCVTAVVWRDGCPFPVVLRGRRLERHK